jgi:hypothetical protein
VVGIITEELVHYLPHHHHRRPSVLVFGFRLCIFVVVTMMVDDG